MVDSQVTINVDDIVKPYVDGHKVDVTKLASKVKVNIYQREDGENSGHIVYDPDKKEFYITLNKDEPITRQRFTIAHELSHYFLHKPTVIANGTMNRALRTKYTKEEREADKLASQILMPAYLVKDYLEESALAEKLDEPSSIIALAETFNVSKYMAIQRLRELKYNVPFTSFA